MATDVLVWLSLAVMAVALLYTSVGHAGASGYIAVMVLMGVAPDTLKPTALALNIMVASLATWRWTRGGRDLDWRALGTLVTGSIPAAFLCGAYQLTAGQYKVMVGAILLAAGLKLVFDPRQSREDEPTRIAMPRLTGIAVGAVIGALSGLTGTGGGIFLTPLLLFAGWAEARRASGLTAPFILVNSIAALAGNIASLGKVPAELPLLVAAALVGAAVGSTVGLNWASSTLLQRLLGAVLLIASLKFLLPG